MRKFIVSSLAVMALAAGGFAVHSSTNTNKVFAQAIVEEDDTTTRTLSTLGGCMVCIKGGRGKNGGGSSCSQYCQ